jgi:tetratricopeptide (TPR) repeat protein
MSRHKIVIAALVGVAAIGTALACGPFFPWQLLDDREATLSDAPAGLGFMSQLRDLVPAPQGTLKAVEHDDSDERQSEALKVEHDELAANAWRSLLANPPTQAELAVKLSAARQARTAEQALAAGAGLPVAVAEYIAGAVAFHDGKFDVALTHFQAIDGLPPEQRRLREVAAAFMQGRSHRELGNFAGARSAFQATRTRAIAGAPDPIGLGVASLGEEARLDLMAADLVPPKGAFSPSDEDRANAPQLIARALRLYGEQAARGSKIGSLSLRDVAAMLASNPDVLGKAIGDLDVRRVLVAYCIANDNDTEWDDAVNGPRDDASANVIAALLVQPDPAAGEDVDRLAMLAYQTGQYDAAEKLTANADRTLGLWVRAKLALRRGDRPAAIRDWGAALKTAGDDLEKAAKTRLQGELAVAQLSDRQFRQSLETLFPLAQVYWGDVAYVAERVLTIEELKAFVDGLPPSPKTKPATSDDDSPMVTDPTQALRTLLARRLMRAGRLDDALAYFPAPKPNEMAAEYRAAVTASRPTGWWSGKWRRISQAEATFKVAMMTRRQGLELLGTEGPPDEASLDGNFSGGVGQSSPQGNRSDPSTLVSEDEAARFAASAPKPDRRFHYREVAADYAMASAQLLPHGSQAYAATLCWAARFAKDSDDTARATSIYRLYVATGPYQAWAKSFGGTCPEPDFDAARDHWPKRIMRVAQRHSALAAAAGIALVLVVAGAVFAVRRRRAA